MKITFTHLMIAALTCCQLTAFASDPDGEETQRQLIEQTLNHYIQGTSYNDQDRIRQAFSVGAELLLENKDKALWTVPVEDYISWFKADKKGQFNGRIGEILSIDIDGRAATAKVEILLPQRRKRYVDFFLLKKLDTGWKIISKTAVGETANNNGKRILFIVSDAFFHGDSQLPAGASFSEIVNAYDSFKQAGYTVDFVSPGGGMVPLSYINTSILRHRQYLYDTDLMYKLKNALRPQQVNPADYLAVHYVGGSNAMYGVAHNTEIQHIAMAVYEEHGGIVSSVCHGTAGIVALKTRDGEYLVKDKRISGYPESFENREKAYFKEFPFLIQKTVEAHGGKFFHVQRNKAHVEVDERVITGQNHLSSHLVAEKIIQMLESQQ